MKILSPVLLTVIALCLIVAPTSASAATSKLGCELTATTATGKVELGMEGTVLLHEDDELKIQWESTNAKRAFDGDTRIALKGSATSTPDEDTTYSYRFENGTKKVTCEVEVIIVKAMFDDLTFDAKVTKPTLKGEVEGQKTVQVLIYKEGVTKPVFTSKVLKVKNGKWSTKVTKTLKEGEYTIVLKGDKKIELNTIAKDTLTIGKEVEKSVTTFVVEPVPLLLGGTAKAGTAAPIAYFQVINIGKKAGKVESFSIKQNGNASVDVITGFTVGDSKSVGVTTIKPATGKNLFKDKVAVLPLNVTIEPGQMKLFTVKALLAPSLLGHIGTQLKLDVSAVGTNGAEKGTIPVRGVTWTLGL